MGTTPTTPPRVTRRRFLRSSAALFGTAGLAPGLLAACGGSNGTGSSAGLVVDTWPIYIDDDPETGTLARFRAATGIEVQWNETFNDTNEYFAKIQPTLSQGKSIGADIIMPTYWLIPRLVGLRWLEPMPPVTNRKNLLPSLQNPVWDPTGAFSLPWQTGITGIAYNRRSAGREIRSMAQFLDPSLKGKVAVLTELRDTVGLFMLAGGADPSQPTPASVDAALARLDKAKSDGQIRRFTGQDYLDDLVAGNFAACVAWSGDVAQLAQENPDIGFAVPEEGGMLWADCMVLPRGAKHLANAATFMNFVYDPVNAARIAAAVQYVSPVAGVAEELRRLGGDAAVLADSTVLFPDDATRARLRTFGTLSEDDEAALEEAFSRIAGT
jgi:spermidine/putrescine transport system substrate-binding protein